MIVNDASRVMLLIVVALTDDSIGLIYNHNMFILQATGAHSIKKFWSKFNHDFLKAKSFQSGDMSPSKKLGFQ
jgi:hypothetical protein